MILSLKIGKFIKRSKEDKVEIFFYGNFIDNSYVIEIYDD